MGVSRRPLARQKGGAAMNLNELKDRAYKTAKAHGWHDQELSDETYLMLIITEIAEAVQAYRKGIRPDIEGYKEFVEAHDDTAITYAFDKYIKGCVEEELADVVIRSLDFAGLHGWDLQHTLDEMKGTSDMDVIIGDEAFVETAFYTCDEFFGCYSNSSAKEAVCSVLVNVVEYCNYKGIDLWWHVEQKMRYNELRPYKHGGKAY